MKVAFHTLGCKVNQNDTHGLEILFKNHGYSIVPFKAGADIYIINTCAVTSVGEQKSRQIIRKAVQYNPEAIVVVTGCYAQTSSGEIAGIPGVNLVVGMADRPRLVELVTDFQKNFQNQLTVNEIDSVWTDLSVSDPGERTRAMLKIEDGCDEFCSYCIVPYARGRVRSMPLIKVRQEFLNLVAKGYREIVLTGIHLGQYGKDLGITLYDLLQELLKIKGEYRIRLGSLEPHDLGKELIDIITGNHIICQHLHIPLQSGSDVILQKMNRHYNLEYYAKLIDRIRNGNDLIAVGTDLIVGFPGETDKDFERTCNFITNQNFSRIHVFRYSPRKGTPAALLPQKVPKRTQEERSKQIQLIAAQSSKEYAEKFLNRKVTVLIEEKNNEYWTGLSGEYIRVFVKSDLNLKNTLQSVLVNEIKNNQLAGTIVFK